METSSKNKRVTFKKPKKHENNKKIKRLLLDLYSQAVINNAPLSQKIELALASLAKYPLTLESVADCNILKGFDTTLCRYLENLLSQKRTSCLVDKKKVKIKVKCGGELDKNPQSPVAGSSKEIHSNEISEEETCEHVVSPVELVEEIKAHETEKPCEREPISLDSDDDQPVASYLPSSYRTKPNTEHDAVILALYLQQLHYPSRPALTKKELIEKSKQHVTFTIQDCYAIRILAKKAELIMCQYNDGVEEFCLTKAGMCVGKSIFDERANDLSKMTTKHFVQHKHDEYCHNQGCPVYRVVPPQCGSEILLHDQNLFIDMPPGTYEIIMAVDKNEPEMLAASTKHHLSESRNLKVGDMLWVARSKDNGQELVLPFIVERKRLDDFAASIKDGRFHEQKFRLRKCGLRNVIYLIEDYPGKKTLGLPKATLEQAKVNTRIHDGFMVHETRSLEGTKYFLNSMTDLITQALEGEHLRGSNTACTGKGLMTFDYFNSLSSKTKSLTVKDIFIKMLVQLKGLSVEKALAITNVYSSPKVLMDAYDQCEGKERELMLANLRYNEFTPKVGPSISKTLCLLFNQMSCKTGED